jgi:outer membrane lipoprotein-sorting protein
MTKEALSVMHTVIRRSCMAVLAAAFMVTVAGTPAGAQTTPAAAPQPAPPLADILAKYHASKGGVEKWKSIQTQKMVGMAAAQGIELALVAYGKRPNLGRQELTISIPGQGEMSIVNIFDGAKAWMINPMMGTDAPQEMPAGDAEAAKDQSDFDGSLIDYATKGFTVDVVGTVTVAGKSVHHLKITRPGRPTQHYYLDATNGTEVKISTEAGAGSPATEAEMSDYRAVDGVMVPFAVKIMQSGQVQAELKLTSVEFNVPVPDALFKVR